ncbi:hypothetical protein TrVE_jg8206 [Triparma verrucosa]|uniref:Matrin-type domain-containing protein n=2 Tax=Triparma TaxID=722752 RepID=A0A9W7EK42_9STRA|nr:hypothetical protein TrST_g5856 [Triparma strigata]GMI03918.1 hypothetical protein TrVE_jg8206 [Triparma verrucosa]
MDMQNRVGSKFGGGGVMNDGQSARDRKERLRQLAMETIDLAKDPYFMRNHLGTYECKLCLTLHTNEGSYMAHTQAKKHQTNLKRRAKEDEDKQKALNVLNQAKDSQYGRQIKQARVKIGRPGYSLTKSVDASGAKCLSFAINYPEIKEGIVPRYRFMSSYEQRVEVPDKNFIFLLFAAEPYETIAFKIPNKPMDKSEGRFVTSWVDGVFNLTLFYLVEKEGEEGEMS